MKEKMNIYLLAVLVLSAVVTVYSNHFYNTFHFDDDHTIVNNIYIRDIGNIPLFFRDATTFSSLPTNQSYRPLLTATLAIDYFLGNGTASTFFFHLSTFIFYILLGILMYFFFLKIIDHVEKNPDNCYIALILVAWYMLHPANAETINYIIQRGESLSAFFLMLAFVLYQYSPVARKWHLYLLPVAAGALAKPMAGIFAPLFIMYLLLFEKTSEQPKKKRSGKKKKKPEVEEVTTYGWTHIFTYAVPAIIFVLAVMLFIQRMDPPTWTPGGTSVFNYVITQPYVILLYFITFFLPVNLSADTDLKPFTTMADIRFVTGMAFLILLITTAIMFLRIKKYRPLSFGIFWFLIALAPTSFIPLAEVMNGHRLFLPMVGLTLGIGWSIYLGIRKLVRSSKTPDKVMFTATVCIAIALIAYGFGTFQRNKVWRTGETLWRDVSLKSPNNPRGLMNYGLALMERGDYEGAERYYTRAYALAPNYSHLHINMAILYNSIENIELAQRHFTSAIDLSPGLPEAYFFYARFLFAHNRYEEAEENLIKAIQLASAHLNARRLLMEIYHEQQDFEKLAAFAEETLRIVPNDDQATMFLALARGEISNVTADEMENPE